MCLKEEDSNIRLGCEVILKQWTEIESISTKFPVEFGILILSRRYIKLLQMQEIF